MPGARIGQQGPEEFLRLKELLYILILVVVTWLNAFVKTRRTINYNGCVLLQVNYTKLKKKTKPTVFFLAMLADPGRKGCFQENQHLLPSHPRPLGCSPGGKGWLMLGRVSSLSDPHLIACSALGAGVLGVIFASSSTSHRVLSPQAAATPLLCLHKNTFALGFVFKFASAAWIL